MAAGWVDVGTVSSPLDQPNIHEVRTFTDNTFAPDTAYQYKIVANNTVGYGAEFPTLTVHSESAAHQLPEPACGSVQPDRSISRMGRRSC